MVRKMVTSGRKKANVGREMVHESEPENGKNRLSLIYEQKSKKPMTEGSHEGPKVGAKWSKNGQKWTLKGQCWAFVLSRYH